MKKQTLHSLPDEELRDNGMHTEPAEISIDLVCGMELDPSITTLSAKFRDEVYYFCSKTCRHHFINSPDMYLG